jgi:hypothetical protein
VKPAVSDLPIPPSSAVAGQAVGPVPMVGSGEPAIKEGWTVGSARSLVEAVAASCSF